MENVSILLVGENGVGKTCLVASYSTGKFQETKLEGIFVNKFTLYKFSAQTP